MWKATLTLTPRTPSSEQIWSLDYLRCVVSTATPSTLIACYFLFFRRYAWQHIRGDTEVIHYSKTKTACLWVVALRGGTSAGMHRGMFLDLVRLNFSGEGAKSPTSQTVQLRTERCLITATTVFQEFQPLCFSPEYRNGHRSKSGARHSRALRACSVAFHLR